MYFGKDTEFASDFKAKAEEFFASAKDTVTGWFDGNNDKPAESNAKSNETQKQTKNTNTAGNTSTSNVKPQNVTNEELQNIQDRKSEISEAQARGIAKNKFIELGEEESTLENMTVTGILRGGEKYYRISSEKNSVEIKIATGEIKIVNNKVVE